MMRALPFALALMLAACGGTQGGASDPDDAAKTQAAAQPIDPKEAAEAAAAKLKADELARQKPEFDAALAAKDSAKLDELADAGNGHALYWRAQERLSSQDVSQQQGGFEDMEAAAAQGIADAQMWVGMKMAYGLDGYQLKPASGLKMMERAARQGNVEAIFAVGQMYAEDTFMADKAKAREWFQRAADKGSEKARQALEKLGPAPGGKTPDKIPGANP